MRVPSDLEIERSLSRNWKVSRYLDPKGFEGRSPVVLLLGNVLMIGGAVASIPVAALIGAVFAGLGLIGAVVARGQAILRAGVALTHDRLLAHRGHSSIEWTLHEITEVVWEEPRWAPPMAWVTDRAGVETPVPAMHRAMFERVDAVLRSRSS